MIELSKYDMSREEAVEYLSKQTRSCGDCRSNNPCGFHTAEIRELQHQFDAEIGDEILEKSEADA